jgi:hypothetical protein
MCKIINSIKALIDLSALSTYNAKYSKISAQVCLLNFSGLKHLLPDANPPNGMFAPLANVTK